MTTDLLTPNRNHVRHMQYTVVAPACLEVAEQEYTTQRTLLAAKALEQVFFFPVLHAGVVEHWLAHAREWGSGKGALVTDQSKEASKHY